MGRTGSALQGAAARFKRAQDGSIIVMGALLLPVLIGVAALVLEFGAGLLTRAANQRSADIAAYAGAIQYMATQSQDEMRASALHTAALNGIAASQVSVALVPSPRGTGEAVQVHIMEQQNIILGTVLGANPLLQINVESYAAVGDQAPPACILALDPNQKGISLSGGTKIAATECSVASNSTITVPCGTDLTAHSVHYDTTPPSQGCAGIKAPDGGPGKITKAHTPDPLAKDPSVMQAHNRLATVAALPALTHPVVASGPDIEFGWNTTQLAEQATKAGCAVSGAAPHFTFSCPAALVELGSITVTGGVNVEFDTGSLGLKQYLISGGITVSSGSTIRFARGKYTIARGVSVQGGNAFFDGGEFRVGQMQTGCRYGSSDRFSLCSNGGGKLTFGGPSTFTLSAGAYTGDGSFLQLGEGSTNRFDIGASTERNSLYVGGGATTIMGDALGDDTSFRMRGHVNGGGGGSCLIVSAAPHHDIAGRFTMAGAVILGAGIYTVDGVFHLAGGGGAPCGGNFVSVRAHEVSIVLSGKDTPSGGACGGQVFCIGAGYGNIELTAPASGPMAHLAVIGPLDGSTKGATLVAGAENTQIAGAFYFPTAPIIMGGGAGVGGSGKAACLQLIATRIELSAGATMASDCRGGGVGQKKRTVVLVQ